MRPAGTVPITKSEARRRLVPGAQYDVTNHYITTCGALDHPCYGTKRRTVLRSGADAFTLSNEPDARGSRMAWRKLTPYEGDAGELVITGHPHAGELFLTIVAVPA